MIKVIESENPHGNEWPKRETFLDRSRTFLRGNPTLEIERSYGTGLMSDPVESVRRLGQSKILHILNSNVAD
jgi:hypothetical protein